jgi:hypothetical protein
MEPEICPPWWPDFLWWLLHHHPVGPVPEPGEEWIKNVQEPIEAILTGLALYTQAHTWVGVKEGGLRSEMQRTALKQMGAGLEQLTEMSRAEG